MFCAPASSRVWRSLPVHFACLCALAGCSSDNAQKTDPRHLTTMISVEGSDTMMSLVKNWAEAYKASHPSTPISMTTADSVGGIAALISGTTDVALSSRELTDEENASAKAKNVHLVKATVALDAIAIIVNPANPVASLSINQLKNIYSGKFHRLAASGAAKSSKSLRILERKILALSNIFMTM